MPSPALPRSETLLAKAKEMLEYGPTHMAHLRARESHVGSGILDDHPTVDWDARCNAVGYIIELQMKRRLSQETMFHAIGMLDRFLAKEECPRNILVTVALVCLWVSEKLYELEPMTFDELGTLSEGHFDKAMLEELELVVVAAQGKHLLSPDPDTFLQRFFCDLQVSPGCYHMADSKLLGFARFLCEAGAMYGGQFLDLYASEAAHGALHRALESLGRSTDAILLTERTTVASAMYGRIIPHVPELLCRKYNIAPRRPPQGKANEEPMAADGGSPLEEEGTKPGLVA